MSYSLDIELSVVNLRSDQEQIDSVRLLTTAMTNARLDDCVNIWMHGDGDQRRVQACTEEGNLPLASLVWARTFESELEELVKGRLPHAKFSSYIVSPDFDEES